ncbi:MAG: PAS domain-containing protein [Phycisphaerales bacterium]
MTLLAAAWSVLLVADRAPAQPTMPTGDPAEAWRTDFAPHDPRATDTKPPIGGGDDPEDADILKPIVPNETRVLFLHSHGPDDGYTLIQSQGFFDALKKRAPGPITSFREYLFMALRSEDEEYHDALAKLLALRYRGLRFSVVMITDTRALHFWFDHMQGVLPDVPAVFSGSYEWYPQFDAPNRRITGAMERVDLPKTIDLIRTLRPGTRHVAVMSMPSFFGRRVRALFDQQLAARPELGVKVTIYEPEQWEQILDPFRANLPAPDRADTLVYVAGPVGLTPGKHLYPPQWMQSQVPGGVPAFALFDAALGPEVIGGIVSSGRRMGEIAGEAAARILYDGVKPADIPIDRGDGSLVPTFRWDTLRKWKIAESALPPGAAVIGRPASWMMRNQGVLLWTAAIAGPVLALTMGAVAWGLVASRRRRTRAETALTESERRLRHAVHGAELGIWEADLATGVVSGSDLFCDLYGLPRGSFLLKTDGIARLHPDDRAAVGKSWVDCIEGRAPYRASYRFRRPDGVERWFKVDGDVVRDGTGKPVKVVGVSADITDRMESSHELEASERRLTELVRNAPLGVIEWDDQWRCTRWDGRAEAIFGWKAEEVLGRSFDQWRFVHEDDAAEIERTVEQQQRERLTTFSRRNRNYTRSGDVRHCEWTNTNIYDESGRRVSTLSMVADVTERERAAELLHDSEERYRLVVRAATDIIWDWDIVSDQVRWSDAAKGLPKGAHPSQGLSIAEWIDHLHPDDRERIRAGFFGALDDTQRQQWSDEYRMARDDGSFAVFADHGFIVRDDTGKAVRMVGAMTDVTQARAMTARIQENEQRLRLALEASAMGTWDADLVNRRIRHSERSAQICGIPPDQLDAPWDDRIARIHPDDRAMVQSAVEDAARTGGRYDATYRLLMPDGSYRWISAQAVVFKGPDGRAAQAIGVLADVTERTEAQEALRRSELKFRRLAETIDECFWEAKPTRPGGITYASPAVERIYGMTAQEVYATPRGWTRAIHPDDQPGAIAAADRWSDSNYAGNYEHQYRVIHPDGSIRWVVNRGYAVRDAAGAIVTVVGAAQDVTARVEATCRLTESEARFREIAENIPQVFWVSDPRANGMIRYVSRAVRDVFGMGTQEAEGTELGWAHLIHPEDAPRAEQIKHQWYDHGCEGHYDNHYRIIRPDGEVRHIHNRGYAVRDPAGHITRIAGLAEDITHRERARLGLAESEQRFREMAENIDQVFWVRTIDTDKIVYASPATQRLWGVEPATLLGSVEHWRRLIHPDDLDRARGSTTRWIADGCKGQHTGEYRIVLADKSERWVASRAKAIEGPDGKPTRILGVTEDITDRVQAKIDLERSLASQRLLLSELDHRVKNNLAGLLALIELNASRQPSVRGFAEAIQRRVSSMASLHALLSASRWEPVDLAQLIHALVPPDAPGSISIHGPATAVPASRATALGMVVHELISNSTKYGALGTVGGHVRVDWSTNTCHEGLCLDLRWIEAAGPSIDVPPAPGLGSSLIDGFARFELRGKATLTYPRTGATHRLECCLVDDQSASTNAAQREVMVGAGLNGK